MRKNILYIMHVDWDWIKQRPHFIAEELNKEYNIIIFYSYGKDRKKMKKNNKNGMKIYPFFKLPFRKKNKVFQKINDYFLKILFFLIIKIKKIDIIWLTHPELSNYINKNNRIFYDCMDDNISLEKENARKNYLEKSEYELVCKSKNIFVTSENLRKKLLKKYFNIKNLKDKLILNRNAYNGKIIEIKEKKEDRYKSKIKLCYVGTVSSWFDIESLKYALEKDSNIEMHIIGPIDVESEFLKNNNRIKLYGPIKHELLDEKIKEMDILIMNFLVNEIILSVDPVKIYEYINYNKPIVCIDYPEVKRFKQYVYFYRNPIEFYEKIKKIKENNFKTKYTKYEREDFLKENTWKNRGNDIKEYLGE